MVTKILDHLYLGDFVDALTFKGTIVCVMQELQNKEPMNAFWVPIVRSRINLDDHELLADQDENIVALRHQIDNICGWISAHMDDKEDILIHCMAGIERSPLVVACYLHDYMKMSYYEAYDFIKEKRPEVANRLSWLNMTYDERMS